MDDYSRSASDCLRSISIKARDQKAYYHWRKIRQLHVGRDLILLKFKSSAIFDRDGSRRCGQESIGTGGSARFARGDEQSGIEAEIDNRQSAEAQLRVPRRAGKEERQCVRGHEKWQNNTRHGKMITS